MSNFETTVYPTDSDGVEWEIEVRIHYDATYQPARISGPPEDCYPADSKMILTGMDILSDLPQGITYKDVIAAADASEERIEEEAWQDFHSRGVDDDR